MNTIPYKPPIFKESSFNCPFCNAFAAQGWGAPIRIIAGHNYGADENYYMCRCTHCKNYSIWVSGKMVYPAIKTAPLSNPDLPIDIKKDYDEARNITSESPRGAAALLRLAIQKLCIHLGEKGKNINDDIASLVKKGLPEKIQQALDIVRVVGNNAVHPGQIDLDDNPDVTNNLFNLINVIVDIMITQPAHISNIYQEVIPDSQKEAIKKRDS